MICFTDQTAVQTPEATATLQQPQVASGSAIGMIHNRVFVYLAVLLVIFYNIGARISSSGSELSTPSRRPQKGRVSAGPLELSHILQDLDADDEESSDSCFEL